MLINSMNTNNYSDPYPSFSKKKQSTNSPISEKKLSHQLQSGSRFNYKVAQLENYKVAQKNYKVAQKLQSGAK